MGVLWRYAPGRGGKSTLRPDQCDLRRAAQGRREERRGGGRGCSPTAPGLGGFGWFRPTAFAVGGRAAVTVGLALLVLFLLAQATHQPIAVVLVGVDISLNCATAINDPDPRQRSITYLLAPFTAAAPYAWHTAGAG